MLFELDLNPLEKYKQLLDYFQIRYSICFDAKHQHSNRQYKQPFLVQSYVQQHPFVDGQVQQYLLETLFSFPLQRLAYG